MTNESRKMRSNAFVLPTCPLTVANWPYTPTLPGSHPGSSVGPYLTSPLENVHAGEWLEGRPPALLSLIFPEGVMPVSLYTQRSTCTLWWVWWRSHSMMYHNFTPTHVSSRWRGFYSVSCTELTRYWILSICYCVSSHSNWRMKEFSFYRWGNFPKTS